jgi:hypothetical protein
VFTIWVSKSSLEGSLNLTIHNSYIVKRHTFEEEHEETALTEKEYEEIVVKLGISNDYLRKLEQLIDVKRIFSSRAEAFRRALELLFEKYEEALKES